MTPDRGAAGDVNAGWSPRKDGKDGGQRRRRLRNLLDVVITPAVAAFRMPPWMIVARVVPRRDGQPPDGEVADTLDAARRKSTFALSSGVR